MTYAEYAKLAAAAGKTLRACPNCEQTDGLDLAILADNQMHWAAIVCNHCPDPYGIDGRRWVNWAQKPTNLQKNPRKITGRDLLNVIREAWQGEPLYCEICLRDERNLPPGTWIEAHHVLEHADGGTDHAANLRAYCNRCHAIVHDIRRAISSYGGQVGKEPNDAESSR